jgi:AraC family transcriptional regulator
VLQRRVGSAGALLADRRTPISDVALACGFADQQHFTKRFRRFTGLRLKAPRDRLR